MIILPAVLRGRAPWSGQTHLRRPSLLGQCSKHVLYCGSWGKELCKIKFRKKFGGTGFSIAGTARNVRLQLACPQSNCETLNLRPTKLTHEFWLLQLCKCTRDFGGRITHLWSSWSLALLGLCWPQVVRQDTSGTWHMASRWSGKFDQLTSACRPPQWSYIKVPLWARSGKHGTWMCPGI